MRKPIQIKRTLMLVAGFLAALVILFTQLSFVESNQEIDKNAHLTEKEATEFPQPESSHQISVSAITMPSILIINYNQVLPVLFELVKSDIIADLPELPFDINSAKLVKYLFRVIIAPNAP